MASTLVADGRTNATSTPSRPGSSAERATTWRSREARSPVAACGVSIESAPGSAARWSVRVRSRQRSSGGFTPAKIAMTRVVVATAGTWSPPPMASPIAPTASANPRLYTGIIRPERTQTGMCVRNPAAYDGRSRSRPITRPSIAATATRPIISPVPSRGSSFAGGGQATPSAAFSTS